jgi:integrase
MKHSVLEYRKFNGDICADIVDQVTGLPASFWVTAYLYNLEKAASTILTEAYQLKFSLEYFNSENICLIERFESGELLSEVEQNGFLRACRYRKDSVVKSDPKIANIHVFNAKALDNMVHASSFSESKVTATTAKMRLTAFLGFTAFLFKRIHQRFGKKDPSELKYKYDCLYEEVKDVRGRIKDDNAIVNDPFEQAISTDGYFKLLLCIKPYHIDNPWTELTRFRNHIILMLFIETGNRLGEICKLKMSDIRDDANPRILITRTPSDLSDPRKRAPSAKTRAHASGISRQLLRHIKLYIDTERSKYTESERHDFLFVSHKGLYAGKPLSKRAVGTIISDLSSVLGEHIHPHLLRHKWNQVFSEKAQELGYSSEKIEEIRRYACAWTEDSAMSRTYNEYHLALTAHKISSHEQSKLGIGNMEDRYDD